MVLEYAQHGAFTSPYSLQCCVWMILQPCACSRTIAVVCFVTVCFVAVGFVAVVCLQPCAGGRELAVTVCLQPCALWSCAVPRKPPSCDPHTAPHTHRRWVI